MHSFIVAIRRIAQDYRFGTMLDRMLRAFALYAASVRRDRQKEFIAKTDLALAEAEALALASENAELDSVKISSDVGSADVLTLKAPLRWRPNWCASANYCARCGKRSHKSAAGNA